MNLRCLPVLLSVLLSGCFYTDIRFPMDRDLASTNLGPRRGTSSMHSVAWLFAWGDAGTEAAAREGGITTLTHMDQRYVSVLFGLYTRSDTIVYGE
jgi:hypothetical protein